MPTNVLAASKSVRFIFFIIAVLVCAFSLSAAAQQTTKNPTKPGDDSGLPLPKPVPTVVKNPDGSTTTTTLSAGTTTAVTVDKNGARVSTVTKYPTYNGRQMTIIDAGNTTVTTEYDRDGTIRHLTKIDSETKTKNVFDYDQNGQLQKAWVFRINDQGKDEPQEIYEPPTATTGNYGQEYNKDTKKWDKIDWPTKQNDLDKAAADIKSVVEQYAPIDKPKTEPEDDLADVRAEAARQPMSGPESPAEKPVDIFAPPTKPLADTEAKSIDPCLIGTWTATSVRDNARTRYTGGTGFTVTFTSDGRETVDYSGMQPLTWANGDGRLSYAGSATAAIEAKDGSAKIDRMENAGATFTSVISVADAARKTKPISDLGIGGLPSGRGTGTYTCNGDSLEYKASHGFASDVTVKLTRVK